MAVSQTSGAFRRRLLAAAIGQALVLGAGGAVAATIPVGGACTLADAVTAANTDAAVNGCPAGSGHDVITLASNSTHSLATELTVSSAVTIQGNGAVIEPSGPFRLLTVEATGDLTLEAVTLQGGDNVAGGAVGVNGGALTVRNSTLRNNTAYAGGAIFSAGGTVALVDSTVSGNYAKYTGGGIYNSGEMTVSGSTVSGNSAGYAGGGIATLAGSLTVTDSTISGNTAIDCEAPGPDCEAVGGGIFAYSGTLSVTGGSISGNYASKYGGGVASAAGVTIDGTTVSENGALLVGGGLAFTDGPSGPGPGPSPGSAPDVQASNTRALASGDVVLRNCTISGNLAFLGAGMIDSAGSATSRCSITGNSAFVAGGGIIVGGYSEHATITESVISGNVAGVYGGGGVGVKYDSSLEVSNSTIADNMAGGYGGGVANSGLLSITNSTLSGNTAGASGGIYNYGALELVSATVAFNRATGDLSPPDRTALSGFTPEQQKQLDRLRPSGTRARDSGAQAAPPNYAGGIGAYGDPGYGGGEYLANTIIAGNTGHDCVGNPETMRAVLVQDGTCGAPLSGAPLLTPLGNHGGPTLTHALQAGSPAIDQGDPAVCAALPTDQRGTGFPRTRASACDLGAVESPYTLAGIPTLGAVAMGLLSLFMGAIGLGTLRRRRR